MSSISRFELKEDVDLALNYHEEVFKVHRFFICY